MRIQTWLRWSFLVRIYRLENAGRIPKFWRRWLKEYDRSKWFREIGALREGNLVLVLDENSPGGHWPMGRISRPLPGKDGVVRTVLVKTSSGEYVRLVSKLSLLDFVNHEAGVK